MLILYTRADCHLCDDARGCIEAAAIEAEVGEVDIGTAADLTARYGTRIPVLRDTGTGKEIGWPFSPAEVESLARNPGTR